MGYREHVAGSLTQLGHIARIEGRHPAARDLYEKALTIRRELGHRREIAIGLQGLGTLDHVTGAYGEARSRYQESLTIARQAGDRSEIALVLFRLGELAVDAGLAPERLAVAWVLAQPGVTCTVIGASRASQLLEVLRAGEAKLNDPVLQELDAITREFRLGDAPPV